MNFFFEKTRLYLPFGSSFGWKCWTLICQREIESQISRIRLENTSSCQNKKHQLPWILKKMKFLQFLLLSVAVSATALEREKRMVSHDILNSLQSSQNLFTTNKISISELRRLRNGYKLHRSVYLLDSLWTEQSTTFLCELLPFSVKN